MKETLEGWGVPVDVIPEIMASVYGLLATYAGKVVGALLVLLLALFVAGWVRSLVERGLRRVDFDSTLTKFLGQASRGLVLLLAVLGCLGIFGIETTSFAAVIGGASLAVGLAFQGSLSNVAAGVMLLTFRPFTVDDVVELAGHTGKVDEIGLFMTTLNTSDRRHIIIPNGQIFGSTIVNITYNPTRRVDISIGTGYDADLEHTRQVLVEAARGIEHRLEDEEPTAFLKSFGGSSVDWQVRVFAKTEDYFVAYEELMRAVKEALEAADIEIPYPHVQVLGVSSPPGGALSDEQT